MLIVVLHENATADKGVGAHLELATERVSEARPKTRSELLALHGIGAVKAQRFGDDLLQVVADN